MNMNARSKRDNRSKRRGLHDTVLEINISPDIICYLLILLAAVLVILPIVIPHVWHRSHDNEHYILTLDHFRDAFLRGILYPRWLPDFNGGYGYPTFLFYQPGFFFLALPFSFLPGYPMYTMYLTLFSLFFAGGAGAYKLCKEISDRAAAALAGAAELPDTIHAVVSRGGRPDLAGEALGSVEAPTLLIVGGDDTVVIDLNLEAMKKIKAKKELKIVPRATHLFEEPGKLEEVARLAKDWFITYLKKAK